MKTFFLLLTVFAAPFAWAEKKEIDSLESLLACSSIVERIDKLNELAYLYGERDYKKGLQLANQALKIARELGDTLQIVKAGRATSYFFRRLNQLDSALTLGSELLPQARKKGFVVELKSILNGLAYVTILNANYDKALMYLFESLEIRKRDGDKFEISVALHNIGLVYYKLGNTGTALEYYQEALSLKNQTDNKYDLDLLLVNIGLCYAYSNLCREATRYIDDGFSKCNNNCSDDRLVQGFLGYGIILFHEDEYSKAEKQFLKSYTLAKKVEAERFQLENIIWLSKIYIHDNKLAAAEKYLVEAEEIIQKNSPFKLELIGIYEQFFKLYQKKEDFKKISIYQAKYISLKDSIFNDEVTKNLMKAEAEFQERENRSRIESQNKILTLKEEVIYRQKVANASMGGIAFLVIILTVILARNNRQKQLRNKLLDEQVKERTKELEMNSNALQRAVQERYVLISEASSDIQSSIATLKGLCFLGSKEIDHPLATEYWKQLDNTSNGLSAVLNKMRYSAHKPLE
ncbi:MAG TPA: tetratricopeptide repeat protein [Chryseolinea sp.]